MSLARLSDLLKLVFVSNVRVGEDQLLAEPQNNKQTVTSLNQSNLGLSSSSSPSVTFSNVIVLNHHQGASAEHSAAASLPGDDDDDEDADRRGNAPPPPALPRAALGSEAAVTPAGPPRWGQGWGQG